MAFTTCYSQYNIENSVQLSKVLYITFLKISGIDIVFMYVCSHEIKSLRKTLKKPSDFQEIVLKGWWVPITKPNFFF